jgi:hypothetical protein
MVTNFHESEGYVCLILMSKLGWSFCLCSLSDFIMTIVYIMLWGSHTRWGYCMMLKQPKCIQGICTGVSMLCSILEFQSNCELFCRPLQVWYVNGKCTFAFYVRIVLMLRLMLLSLNLWGKNRFEIGIVERFLFGWSIIFLTNTMFSILGKLQKCRVIIPAFEHLILLVNWTPRLWEVIMVLLTLNANICRM